MKRKVSLLLTLLLSVCFATSASSDSYNLIIHVAGCETVGNEPNSIPQIPLTGSYSPCSDMVSLQFDYPLGGGMVILSSTDAQEMQIVEFGPNQTQIDISLCGFDETVMLDIYTSGFHYYTLISK